jgi:hypothetical protein
MSSEVETHIVRASLLGIATSLDANGIGDLSPEAPPMLPIGIAKPVARAGRWEH